MQTLKTGILRDMFNQLYKYIIKDKADIGEWRFTKGVFKGEDGYEMSDFEGTIKSGDRHYPGYDAAHFFTASVTVPGCMDGQEIRVRLAVGGEALVKCNGKYVAGCTTRDSIPDRTDFSLGKIPAGTVLCFEIEATCDSMIFCDEHIFEGKNVQECNFGETCIYTVNPDVEAYIYDIEVAFEALEYIEDEYIRSKVYSAVDDSLHTVNYDFENDEVIKSIAEARVIYNDLISQIKWTPQSEVIMTGHSHIDVAWLWRVQESIRKSARTFSNVVNLMNQYPEMTFSQSQAVLYKMIKDHYPEIFEKIKEKVALGQWDICGNVWVEADTNIASGESLIRQVLYGTEFFRKEFGKVSKTYWLPDCFGFSAALPQIIKGCGMENFITSKLSYNDTTKFPYNMFMWKGNSGDTVYAHLMNPGYNGQFNVSEIAVYDKECNDKHILNTCLGMFGYGDGGGGPTKRMLEKSKRLKNYPGLPATKIGLSQEFFDTYHGKENELPVWCGEMYYENHRGTFTSQAFVKKNNRKGEYLLTRNEMISVFNELYSGREYPKEEIENLWQILMTNQFHDILPGSSIHEVFEDCKKTYADFNCKGSLIRDKAYNTLNGFVTAQADSVIVWNLSSFECAEAVEIAGVPENMIIEGLPSINNTGKLIFTPEIKPFSYKTFRLVEGKTENKMNSDIHTLENDYLSVKIDDNGQLISVYDKINGREALDGKGNILTISLDKCIHETAWNLELNYQKKMWELTDVTDARVIEDNNLRKVIRFTKKFNKSVITQDYILYYNGKSVIFDTSVDWHETDKVLKAGFDVAVMDTEATYDIAHGAFRRPTHWNTAYDKTRFEVAAHKWADLSEGSYGCSIINDCKYGYDIHNSHMRITLMRAPTCPDPVGDHGVNTFRYEFHPHCGDWRNDTVKLANNFNIPSAGFYCDIAKTGIIPENKSLIEISEEHISVECLKKAQDGNGYILRVAEDEQQRGDCRIKLDFNFNKVYETNMIEENINEVESVDNSFEFFIKPFEVKTFRII